MKTNDIDGWLYVGVAVCAAITASLGSDDAAKFISPEYLFRLKTIVGAIGAGMLAGKMYRSTTFANNQAVASQTAPPAPISPAAPETKPAATATQPNP